MGDTRSQVANLDTLDSEPSIRTCPTCGGVTEAAVCPNDGTATAMFAPRPRLDDYVGRVIAERYRIESLIGEGGMGRVYAAMQFSLDQRVAIKVLPPEREDSELSIRRFHREARAATRLHSPHVVRVYDFGVDPGTAAPFLVMEFLRGQTVQSLLRSEGALPERRSLSILQHVLRALVEAEATSIVHRDIKPENLFVVDTGDQSDFVKVMDFGVARSAADSQDGSGPLTLSGRIVGTPAYMSPEQVRGGEVTSRSDLYSVGCTLHELLTASRPYADSTDAVTTLVAQVSSLSPQLPERAPSGDPFSPSVRCIHDAFLQKRPADRPPTARSALQAVQASLDGRPTDEVRALLAGRAATDKTKGDVAAADPSPPSLTAPSLTTVTTRPKRSPWVWVSLASLAIAVAIGARLLWPDDARSGSGTDPLPTSSVAAPRENPAPPQPLPTSTGPLVAAQEVIPSEPRRGPDEESLGAARRGPELAMTSRPLEVDTPPDPPTTVIRPNVRKRPTAVAKPPVDPQPIPSTTPEAPKKQVVPW
jgi:serine/threonine protein kinase